MPETFQGIPWVIRHTVFITIRPNNVVPIIIPSAVRLSGLLYADLISSLRFIFLSLYGSCPAGKDS